jgi:hypothetical protein
LARLRRLTVLAMVLASTSATLADPLGVEVVKLGDERLPSGLYPAAPIPEDFTLPSPSGQPPFEIDWSLGLRGSLTRATAGETFVTTLTPQFSATHDGRLADIVVEGDADISRSNSGDFSLSGLRLGLTGTAPIDSVTTIRGNASVDLSQELPGAFGLNPLVTVPPQIITGSVSAGIDRQFGKFNLGLRGDAARTLNGESTRSDTGVTDNSDQNLWEKDATLRLGLQATPIFEVFGEAGIGRDMFDAASTTLGVREDATSRTLRGGIAGNWNDVFSASASIGVGQRDFDDTGLADVTTELYDASISFRPDPTLNLSAQLSTTVEPSGADASGTARVDRSATASVDYTVNSWLRLRASAEWGQSELVGTAKTENRHGFGAGADYALNRHAALSADYGYNSRENSVTGVSEAHRVSLGITIRR